MGLPIKTFWLMSGNIENISAQRDMRSLNVATCCQSEEGSTAHRERLVIETGEAVVMEAGAEFMDEQPDKAGIEELRMMAR